MPIGVRAGSALQPPPNIAQAIAVHEAAMNNSRHVPSLDDLGLLEAGSEAAIFIFNVGPWAHRRDLGSAGTYFVRACPEGREHSEPVELPAVCPELYPYDETAFRPVTPIEKGIHRAGQIIGVGPHVAPNSSLVKYGVFISHSNPPKKEEVAAAKKALHEHYQRLVKEAGDAYALGPAEAKNIIDPMWHFEAARRLKKTVAECPWLANTADAAEERQSCPGCGEAYKVGIIRHACGWIFDKKKWEENQGKG